MSGLLIVRERAPAFITASPPAPAPQVIERSALLLFSTTPTHLFSQPRRTMMVQVGALRGVQGPPGPQQFYLQDTEPAPVAGLPLLFFQTGQTADPDDVIPSVIV